MATDDKPVDGPEDSAPADERDAFPMEFVPPPAEPPRPLPAVTGLTSNAELEDRFQFFVSDLLLLTFGVAAGFAGGQWIPAELFTFIMGSATVAGIILHHFTPPTRRWMVVMWITILAGYMASFVAMVLKLVQGRMG